MVSRGSNVNGSICTVDAAKSGCFRIKDNIVFLWYDHRRDDPDGIQALRVECV